MKRSFFAEMTSGKLLNKRKRNKKKDEEKKKKKKRKEMEKMEAPKGFDLITKDSDEG